MTTTRSDTVEITPAVNGERAMTGASVLARSGRGHLSVLIGGPEEWAETTGQGLVRGP